MRLIHNWLNGDKEYWTGVAIYKAYGKNELLKKMFASVKSDYHAEKLADELQKLCQPKQVAPSPSAAPKVIEVPKDFSNTELFSITKNNTDKRYKEVMNARAVLFAMVDSEQDLTLINTPDKVAARKPLCFDVVMGYRQVSADYDTVDFVKKNGKLPNEEAKEDDDKLNADDIPDELVFTKLDNARKNYNKMKKREHTPERVQMLQERKAFIDKLTERWQLLKQKQQQ